MLRAVGRAGRHRLALLRELGAGCSVTELHAPCMPPAWQHFESWASVACQPAGIYGIECCIPYTVWCFTPRSPHAGQPLSGLPAAAALLRMQHGQHQRSKVWPPMQQAWRHASAHLGRDEERQPAPVLKAAAPGNAVAVPGTTASPVTISGVLSPADTYSKVCRAGLFNLSIAGCHDQVA